MSRADEIQYSGCNEDSRSELLYFQSERPSVFTIAAGGGRAFALLLRDPVSVTAIDANPGQIALCELKRAAIRAMTRDEFLEFIGIGPASPDAPRRRLASFARLKPDLPLRARVYWSARTSVIAEGLIDCGVFDRGVVALSKLVFRAAGKALRQIREASDEAERLHLVESEISGRKWDLVFSVAFSSIVGRWIIRDRSFYGPDRTRSGQFVLDRFREFLRSHAFDDSFIAHLYLYGRLSPDGPLPVYLEADNYEAVRARLDRIEFVQGDLIEILKRTPSAAIDAFSMSDIQSYIGPDEFAALCREIGRVGSNGARVCFREFLRQPRLRCQWPPALRREPEMDARLDKSDRSIGFTFVCATVAR